MLINVKLILIIIDGRWGFVMIAARALHYSCKSYTWLYNKLQQSQNVVPFSIQKTWIRSFTDHDIA